MKRIFKAFAGILPVISALTLGACGNDAPVAKTIVVNQKMILVEWPDSQYIASLDSILAMEPVKEQKNVDANLTMKGFNAPGFKLPSSVTGKPDPKSKANHQSKTKPSAERLAQAPKADNSAENFANKFSDALSRLQSDPSNASLYKTVEAKDGDDLFKLLKRTYGAGVQNLPRFYILSALQSVNAGVSLEHLNAGDKVRIPKI
ncbi:MAG: hypothetical protein MJZ26_10450 [Fibrobacter sp.]|nr:hypothetical protein [Fibrobacter sp.]